MSLCPVCGRYLCDHTPAERGQTVAEMMRPLSIEEKEAWESGDPDKKLRAAQKHAHDPVTKTDIKVELPFVTGGFLTIK